MGWNAEDQRQHEIALNEAKQVQVQNRADLVARGLPALDYKERHEFDMAKMRKKNEEIARAKGSVHKHRMILRYGDVQTNDFMQPKTNEPSGQLQGYIYGAGVEAVVGAGAVIGASRSTTPKY